MVPHLATALSGPINELEQRILESMPAIERWFRLEWMEHTPPIYSAADIRNAGYKLAPVDTDLFPAAFNHLPEPMMPLAIQAAMAAIEKICPEAKNLLLIPGPHTDDGSYLNHLAQLVRIFSHAGLNVRLGSLDETVVAPIALELPEGGKLMLEPLVRTPRRVGLKDFDPCTVLLNNDLSTDLAPVLENLHEQYLLPPLHAGWAVRRRHRHFHSYEEVAKKFAKLLGMDPWLINPLYGHAPAIDWATDAGVDAVQAQVDAVLTRVRRKHKEYGIPEKPYVVVRADQGADRLGPTPVHDARDLEELVRRAREHAGAPADGPDAVDLIIQEGVPTHERIDDAVADPVVYMIDRYVVGGFYRMHAPGAPDRSLDDAGPGFVPLAFAESAQLPRPGERPGASAPNRFYMYGVIGRLAMLAASYELEATDPQAEVYD